MTYSKRLRTTPTLFFLDPFGYKGMEWTAMQRLAKRADLAKTELLINFNVGKVDFVRNCGRLRPAMAEVRVARQGKVVIPAELAPRLV